MIWAAAALLSASENPGLPLSEALPLASAHYGVALTAEGTCAQDVAAWRLDGMPLEDFKRRLAWASRAEWKGDVLTRPANFLEAEQAKQAPIIRQAVLSAVSQALPWAENWAGHVYFVPGQPTIEAPKVTLTSQIEAEPRTIPSLAIIAPLLDFPAILALKPGQSITFSTEADSPHRLPAQARIVPRVTPGEEKALQAYQEPMKEQLAMAEEGLKKGEYPPEQAEDVRRLLDVYRKVLAQKSGDPRPASQETRVVVTRDGSKAIVDIRNGIEPMPAIAIQLSRPGALEEEIAVPKVGPMGLGISREPLAHIGQAILKGTEGPTLAVLPDQSLELALPGSEKSWVESGEGALRPSDPVQWLFGRIDRETLINLYEETHGGHVFSLDAVAQFVDANPILAPASPLIDAVMRRREAPPLFPTNPWLERSESSSQPAFSEGMKAAAGGILFTKACPPELLNQLAAGQALKPTDSASMQGWSRQFARDNLADAYSVLMSRIHFAHGRWTNVAWSNEDAPMPESDAKFWLIPTDVHDFWEHYAWTPEGRALGPYYGDLGFRLALNQVSARRSLAESAQPISGVSALRDRGMKVWLVWGWDGNDDEGNGWGIEIEIHWEESPEEPGPGSIAPEPRARLEEWTKEWIEKLRLPPGDGRSQVIQ